MSRLFNSKEVSEYTSALNNQMKSEIMKFSNQQILQVDLDEWAVYFESKFTIQPIVLLENNITNRIKDTKIKEYDRWKYNIPYGKEYVYVDGYKITFSIPYNGDENLLYLKPKTYILTSFNPEKVEPPQGDICGLIELSFEYIASELKTHENNKDYVWKEFTKEFDDYKKMIEYVNLEIKEFNDSLNHKALRLLEERKKKADEFALISDSLNIPLSRNENKFNVVPRPLKKVQREPVPKPELNKSEIIQEITDEDYYNIIKIIHSICTSMEDSSSTYSGLPEEALRDFIIATLETHYESKVTAETFRKNGKTDIRVIFDNKAAFIGECKIWHGIKKFEDAIQQLFGYSTWRDSKMSLIVFNKDAKDFKSIREKIQEWIIDNTKNNTQLHENVWNCVIHRHDKNEDVKVVIALYDLTN